MKVLHLFQPSVGGVPAYVARLTAGLAAHGVENVVVGPSDARLRFRADAPGVDFHGVPTFTRMPSIADARVRRVVAETVERFAPDVVHAHSTKAGWVASRVARRMRVPVVFTPHAWSFQMVGDRTIARRVLAAVERRSLARCQATVVAICDFERDVALGAAVVRPSRVRVVHTAAPRAETGVRGRTRSALGMRPGDLNVVWIGRPGPQKQVQHVAAIAKRAPGAVRFWVLGGGLAATPEAAELAAAGVSIVDEAVASADLMAAGDVYLMTSAWEGFPLTGLEALASGTPMVAYPVGGVPEQVWDGETGFLTADPAAAAARVAQFAADRDLVDRMGRASVRAAEVHFPADRMIHGVIASYDETVAARTDRPGTLR